MAHIPQQSASGKFSNSRAGRDADPRVALPLTFSPPKRAVAASGAKPSSVNERSVTVAQVHSSEEHPTIVQSSAELASKAKMPGNDGVAHNVRAAIKAGEMTNYSTDLGFDIQLQGSHYVKVEMVDANTFDIYMSSLHCQFGWGDKTLCQKVVHAAFPGQVTLYIVFDDIRDTITAQTEASAITGRWVTQHVTFDLYASVMSTEADNCAKYDGQVMFEVKFVGRKPDMIDIDGVRDYVFLLANEFGELRVFKDVSHTGRSVWQFRVEYWKISNAKEALMAAGPNDVKYYKNWAITAKEIVDMSPINGVATTATTQQLNNGNTVGIQCSPTGRTSWSTDENGNQIPQQPTRQLTTSNAGSNTGSAQSTTVSSRERFFSAPTPDTQVTFSHHPANNVRSHSYGGTMPPHNRIPWYVNGAMQSSDRPTEQHVNVYTILGGRDIRTTIMLRNVPNQWTAENLKQALDSCSFGRYDFSYLRIDFSQNTNVGYAFVNFCEARDIVAFVNRWVGREWETGGYPRKTCQISYATIQGVECLIEKFRNSAVMDEFPGFRPKLWFTFDSAVDQTKVGTEREFPTPNNLSKKQRSHDNAGTVGLYAPRSNQRGGDRPRRSQFDRGTPAQINDDAAFYNLVTPARHPYTPTAAYHHQPRQSVGAYYGPVYYGDNVPAASYGYNGHVMPEVLNNLVPHTYHAPAAFGETVPRTGLPGASYQTLAQDPFVVRPQAMDLAHGAYGGALQYVNGAHVNGTHVNGTYVDPNSMVTRSFPDEHNVMDGQATATSVNQRRAFGLDMMAIF